GAGGASRVPVVSVQCVNAEIRRLLTTREGVLTRREVLDRLPQHVLEHAVRSDQLRRAHPQVYVDPDRVDEPRLRHRAALAYGGRTSALCGVSALAVWGLCQASDQVHVMTSRSSRLRARSGIVIHRRQGFQAPRDTQVRDGLTVTRLEQSVVDSARHLPAAQRRASFIDSVARRMTTPDRLRAVLEASPNVPGRHDLLRLTSLLERGCRSELELWGFEHIFRGSGLPRFRRQFPVQLGRRTVYLDVYAERERINVELDGAAHHSSRSDRERDLRRDAALGALGIMVVRFSHRRLSTEPDAVRREVRGILAARRTTAQ
ncbi:MAG: DUF559 domain-containing protein, partial [Haloechinothrix sp.]